MTDSHPKLNAPGLVWRRRKSGWHAQWQARTDLVRRGFEPKHAGLWSGVEPDATALAFIEDRCLALQAEMLAWARGAEQMEQFDGTLRSLSRCYQTDPDSGFSTVRYVSRMNYATLLRVIEKDHGDERLVDINARLLKRWHEQWTVGGKIAMAHSLMGRLRAIFSYGFKFLEDAQCQRIREVLSDMEFPMAKPRKHVLTATQADLVRAEAHRDGMHSLGLAQAIQFDVLGVRQKDVIGEWVPVTEPGISDVTAGNEKWLRGLRWNQIDENLILRHTNSKREKDIERDLKLCPMVMEEFARIGALPKTGPMIISEVTGRPWRDADYRYHWRRLATAVGIPKAVKNMDSRAGAITEATHAGASLQHIQAAATHSDMQTTLRYAREDTQKAEAVQKARLEQRNKSA